MAEKKKAAAPAAAVATDKKKALETALAQIEKNYGKGAIMRLGDDIAVNVEAIPTGSLSLDLALGIGGVPRGRIVEIYGPESCGKTTLALHIVASVKSSKGPELYKAPSTAEQVFDANDTGLVVKAMEGTIQYGTGRAASAIGKTMAGKSGTANDNKAVSFIGFTPSTLTMFAIWNPGANGEALELPTINGYYKGMGYPAVLFTNYMSRALENVADEKFPDVTDSGKIGGPDGTWGTGSQYSSWGNSGQSQSGNSQGGSKSDDQSSQSGTQSGDGSGSQSTTPQTGNGSNGNGNGSGGNGSDGNGGNGGNNGNNGNGGNNGNNGGGSDCATDPTAAGCSTGNESSTNGIASQ